MSLAAFLSEGTDGSSWADEMNEYPIPISLPDNERKREDRYQRDQGFARQEREQLPLPTSAPFNARVNNLGYEVNEDDIRAYFSDVKEVRLITDKMTARSKGIAFVEFETLDGLKQALDKSGLEFAGRSVFVNVAEARPERAEGGSWRRAESREPREQSHEPLGPTQADKDSDWRSHPAPVSREGHREPRFERSGSDLHRRPIGEPREPLPPSEADKDSDWRRHAPVTSSNSSQEGRRGRDFSSEPRHRSPQFTNTIRPRATDTEWRGGGFADYKRREPRNLSREGSGVSAREGAEEGEHTNDKQSSDWRQSRSGSGRGGRRYGNDRQNDNKDRDLSGGWRRV
ncbi:Eukaryotic translation initiation factor 4B [Mycoemilia scoparia]|uniref:Eukaryotic translation initiation factor 4B n=1 Tax=Mycoemilia scoparia TaxID=417184 RepID=A0A9W8A600_9FUNG|nr:Eukaryotic translation initiation factor 4B [Mycoemilia scoparia]